MTEIDKVGKSSHADRVARWLREGQSERWIAAQLAILTPEATFTRSDIRRFKDRLRRRAISHSPESRTTWNDDPRDAYDALQRALDKVLARPPNEPWNRETRETLLTELKIAKEKLRLLGRYPERKADAHVVIGVQLETAPAGSLGEVIWRILEKDKKQSS